MVVEINRHYSNCIKPHLFVSYTTGDFFSKQQKKITFKTHKMHKMMKTKSDTITRRRMPWNSEMHSSPLPPSPLLPSPLPPSPLPPSPLPPDSSLLPPSPLPPSPLPPSPLRRF